MTPNETYLTGRLYIIIGSDYTGHARCAQATINTTQTHLAVVLMDSISPSPRTAPLIEHIRKIKKRERKINVFVKSVVLFQVRHGRLIPTQQVVVIAD